MSSRVWHVRGRSTEPGNAAAARRKNEKKKEKKSVRAQGLGNFWKRWPR